MKKKFLALVMTLSMVLSLVPMTALAAEDSQAGQTLTAAEGQTENAATNGDDQKDDSTIGGDNSTGGATTEEETTKKNPIVEGVKYDISSGYAIVVGCEEGVEELTIPKKISFEGTDYNVTKVVCGLQNNSTLKSVNIQAEITTLDNSIFSNDTSLTSVTLPDSLKTIEPAAFKNCSSLTQIDLPEGLEVIKNSVFAGTAIEEITLPSTLTLLQNGAFQKVTTLKTVDFNNVETTIGNSCFQDCTNLTSITGVGNITSIGNKAFYGCKVLGELSSLNNVTSIGDEAFLFCKQLKKVEGLHNLTSVGARAFAQCSSIEKLDIDWSKVEKIGDSAFLMAFANDAEKIVLDSNSFKSLKKIGRLAFTQARNITGTLVLPEGIESIDMQAFAQTGISSVVFPNSLKSIGWLSFNSCEKLESVIIGNNNESAISTLNKDSFKNCEKLASVKINTSKDLVNIPDETFEDTVTVTYTLPSIQESSTETERLVETAQTGGTIELDHDVRLMETVTIPSGKTLTITTSEGTSSIMLANKNIGGPMFKVENDAHLILDGDISYQCQWLDDNVFAEVKGTLTLQKGEISRVETTSTNRGAIKVSGGTFNMDGGIITRCTFGNQYSGSVLLADGGSMTMSGGTIDGNTATEFNSAGGVLVNKDSTFTMTGGTISNNSAKRGGGVLVRENGQFKMPKNSKGMISGNTAQVQSSSIEKPNAGGGGVFVEHNASFEMKNGTITRNTTNGMGGGVATAVLNEDDETGGGQFLMTGGTISNNEASCGGGVYSWSRKDRVVLEGGNIIGNIAYNQGGGVYVSTHPYGLTINHALVTDNTATIMGGGVWACPTGTVTLGTDSAVFDNTAEKAGADIALLNKNEGYYSTFSNKQLGGGLVTWYKDNFVTGNQSQWGSHGDYRYDANDPGNPVISATNSMSSYSLKAVVSNDGKSLAKNAAKLFIQDNTAQRGGGVGTNGEINFSGANTPENPISVTVHKVWSGNNGNYPSTVKVNLVRTKDDKSQTIATVILSEKSKDKEDTKEEKGKTWSYIFSNLDDSYTYTVTEDEVPGYRTNITKNTEGNNLTFTITNTRKGGGGSGGGGTVTIPDDVPTGLDLKNHYGYIIGYPVDYYTGKPTTDQTKKPVRPEGKITRAEVATIYFRMLTDENRAANWNQVSGFSDVKSSAWYNNAISTLTKAGILKGYEDGTFQPNGYITRAEFATIAIRFFSGVYEGEDLFPDIKGHWAEDYINNAANKGLVKGYEDGTFGPDRYITRAEAVTLVNRTLNRHPHNDGLHKDMLVWPDNMDTSKWYYADMQEATNSHEPDKNQSTADKEYWGKMLPIRDWEALEKEWSNANSAPGEGEVV